MQIDRSPSTCTDQTSVQVSFQWKNPDFLLQNPDLMFRDPDFRLKNVECIIKHSALTTVMTATRTTAATSVAPTESLTAVTAYRIDAPRGCHYRIRTRPATGLQATNVISSAGRDTLKLAHIPAMSTVHSRVEDVQRIRPSVLSVCVAVRVSMESMVCALAVGTVGRCPICIINDGFCI